MQCVRHVNFECHRIDHIVVAHRGHQSKCLTLSERSRPDQLDAPWTTTPEPGHLVDRSLVANTNRVVSISPCRVSSGAVRRGVRPLPFHRSETRLFQPDLMTLKEPRYRVFAGSNPSPAKFHDDLLQRQIRLFGYQRRYPSVDTSKVEVLPPRGLGAQQASFILVLKLGHSRTWVDLEELRNLPPRSSCLYYFDRAPAQFSGIGSRHAPSSEVNQCQKIAHLELALNPPDLKRMGYL